MEGTYRSMITIKLITNIIIMKTLFISLMIAIGVTLTIIADMFLKKSGWHDWKWIAAGFLTYGLIAIPVAAAFKYTDFGKLFLIWEGIAIILGLAVATLYYKEPITSYRTIAFGLTLAALYFSYK